jgi:hypothetical protein
MDNSDLFSHPETPESFATGEVSGKPVEYPTFSDRPGADTASSATRRS